ncbi:MAG: O-methyltransferase [Chitinophagaceae bacterium]|nr:O-methyltransferase [Chitinophagaceae bacterium]
MDIASFASLYSSAESPLLAEISEHTRLNHPEQHMLSGHVQGKWLEMISHMIRPRRVLEIGTFTGYSALCLAAGLVDDGELHTIELREADAATARGYFNRSEFHDRIILHTGNALQIIPTLKETWDLVFIDADKTGYKAYFDLVLPHVRPNGFILADNIFFHGHALEEQPKGKNAKAIKAFNEKIRERTDIEKLVITIRDGLYLIRKK